MFTPGYPADGMIPRMVAPQMVAPQMVAPQMVVPQMAAPQMVVPQMAGQPAAGFVSPPASPSFPYNVQYNGQPGFSAFTPDYQQFPYTFSSCSPPVYSWANTNSTDIMKFTGSSNPLPLDTSAYHHSNFGSVPKRKIDLDAELPQPPKMRITEEKVSASLRDMHISTEFIPHNYCTESSASDMDTLNPTSITNTIKTTKSEPQATLVMCEELRKLNKIDSIIPKPLLNAGRPTDAVVIWKPQPVFCDFVRSFSDDQESESTVVITEITDEEEEKLNNQYKMLVEDNDYVAVEDDEMEL